MTCLAEGVLGVAKVAAVHCSRARRDLVRITLRDGRTLVSTPEHAHFAGFVALEETYDGFAVTQHARIRPGGPEMAIEQSIIPGFSEDEVEMPFGQVSARGGGGRHVDARRGRRLRRRAGRRAHSRRRPPGLRPRRRAHPQLHRQRHRHPQTRSTASAAPRSAT
jgi:hypothetical protein